MPKRKEHKDKWSPEIQAAMLLAIQQGGATQVEVGREYGISGERVRQLVGNTGPSRRRKVRGQFTRAKVKELAEAGLDDRAIAAATGLGRRTVGEYRLEAGIIRPNPNKRWTPELIIERAQWWYQQFGSLSAADWFPEMAKKYGHTDRLIRYRLLRPPHCNTVRYYFGTWSEMKRQAGIPESPRGGPSHRNRKRTQPAE